MIIDATVCSSRNRTAAVLPGLAIASGDGVQITCVRYDAWLTGSVDYAVIQYRDASSLVQMSSINRMLARSRTDDAFKILQAYFFLVEAKLRQLSDIDVGALVSSIAEAVAQAVALQQTTRSIMSLWQWFPLKPVLSFAAKQKCDFSTDVDIIHQLETSGQTSYESASHQLGRETLGNSSAGTGRALYEMAQLALEGVCHIVSIDGERP
ncbi:hypothetical protein BU15DRAFT_51164 [Melanogaster broomeanus]|nr:hypothetical protein BU15DRAFT_51164 [Melanogaster broomeanus]